MPYKLFVVEAARRGFGQLAWAGLTAVLRGTRMVTVTVLALAASAIVTALAPAGMVGSLKLAVVAVGLVLFVIGLRVVWNVWANRTVDPRQRSGNHPGQVGDRAIVPHSGRSGRRGRMLPTHRQRGVDARTKSRRSSFPRRLRPPSG